MQQLFTSLIFLTLLHCYSQAESLVTSIPRGPSDLVILSKSEREIKIEWSTIESYNVERYHIIAEPVERKSYTDQPPSKLEWTFGSNTNNTDILGLEPGTQYNISIFASTDKGNTGSTSELAWTNIAAPKEPLPVEIIKREGKLLHVRLHPEASNTAITMNIKVIVLERSPVKLFNPEQLKNYTEAEKTGVPFYIAAELSPEEARNVFAVGDGKTYRGYYNAPLIEGAAYDIIQGTTHTLNGITKSSFSVTDASNVTPLETITRDKAVTGSSSNAMMTVILATAIGVLGFLLLISFVLYYLLRQYYGKRKPSEELVLHIHGSESENGSIPGTLQIEDTDFTELFGTLKDMYWHIPRNHIDVHQTILGQGKFGEVREGIVHRRTQDISSLIQQIHILTIMDEKERKSLLSELEAMIHLVLHPFVVEFIGIYEERDMLNAVIENYQSTLRGTLLRSRHEVDGLVCSLSPTHLIEIMLSITQGMMHLGDYGILHRHLSSRSIVMMDGCVPKITNFGLCFYNPSGKHLDFTRWTAPESLTSTIYTVKSDVWSFGVLLWEICALAGTPYVTVPRNDLQSRIACGMRLPQAKGVSDQLYQLMLRCWEFDLHKRPTFHELAVALQNMLVAAKDHLRLNVYPGFQYEKFDPSADEL